MRARPIDPRDTETEVTSPTYRVFFWEPQVEQGLMSHEYEITDALDVQEVLEWATTNAGDRTFTAYVVIDETLVRLVGRDPTVPE